MKLAERTRFWLIVIAIIAIFTSALYSLLTSTDPIICTMWVKGKDGIYYCREPGSKEFDRPVPMPSR